MISIQGGPVFNRSLVMTIAVALVGTASAHAETALGVYVGGGYSDNLARVSSGKQGEGIFVAGADLGWHRQGTRIDGNITAGFDWYKYGGNLFNDELLGHGIADLRLGLVPDRIVWVVAENFGQTAADPLQPATAANRQNVSVLSTGPDLKARLGAATTVMVSGRYDDVRYEVAPTDYTGWSGLLTLGREISAVSTLNLVGGRERVDYKQNVFPNYDRDQAYLQYLLNGSRTGVDLSLGWSRIKRDTGHSSEPLARLSLSRKVSALSTLTLSGQYGLSTGGEIFRSLQQAAPGTLSSQADGTVGDAARQTLVSAAWNTQWARTALDLSATFGKEEYDIAANRDVDRRGASLGLTRSLTPSLTAGVLLSRERRDYTSLGRVFNDTGYSLTAQKRLGRSLSAVLELSRSERTDTLRLNGYTENIAFLRLKWARKE